MKLVYCDESGDPGKPPRSQTPIFIHTFLYLNSSDWREVFHEIYKFRQQMKTDFNLPVRLEFHARNFILNKSPYTRLNLSNASRIKIFEQFTLLIKKLSINEKIQCISTAIVKSRIGNDSDYSIFYQSLTYGLTRIDTNIYYNKEKFKNFILIIDDGNYLSTRKITRKLVRHNFVPYENSEQGRQIKLDSLIDDPLQKKSKDSYLIQAADLISYIVSQYVCIKLNINSSPKRKKIISDEIILSYMSNMENVFNKKASQNGEFDYGIVVHPLK